MRYRTKWRICKVVYFVVLNESIVYSVVKVVYLILYEIRNCLKQHGGGGEGEGVPSGVLMQLCTLA